jgi:hypothetical protein
VRHEGGRAALQLTRVVRRSVEFKSSASRAAIGPRELAWRRMSLPLVGGGIMALRRRWGAKVGLLAALLREIM